jgi:hypothetical protein
MTKCLLFTDKLVVFKYCFIFIVLGSDTSSLGSLDGQDRGCGRFTKGWSLPVSIDQAGN